MKQVSKFLFLLIFASGSLSFAQTQDSYDYSSEFVWGINKNSSGGLIGGFTFKSAHRINDRVFATYGLEIMNVKNPHEVRVQSQSSGNYFIYGKTNYLYAFRLQYGRDVILFTKGPQQGVEVKGAIAAGPSIGIIAPYYVEVTDGTIITKRVQYSTQNYSEILGTGGLFQGLGDSKIQLGLNIKAALNFEWGPGKNNVQGFEAGFLLDAYNKTVELMGRDPATKTPIENYAVYPTVFLTLFFGSRK